MSRTNLVYVSVRCLSTLASAVKTTAGLSLIVKRAGGKSQANLVLKHMLGRPRIGVTS
jgi:hypothetical protein